MSNITTIRVSGQTYQISDSNAQPLLVSGTNIKTINNESLLGSGNITIQGGGGGNNVIEVTQAEYDALVSAGTLDLTALYVITDATEIDISNYWTSAQTQTAINRATSGKQDTLIAGDNITISGNVISATGGGGSSVNVVQTTGTSTTDVMSQDAVTSSLNNKANKSSAVAGYQFGTNNNVKFIQLKSPTSGDIGQPIYYPTINGKGILSSTYNWAKNNYDFQLVEASAITSSITSASTDSQVPSAKAVYDAIPTGGTSITIDPTLDSGSTNAVANSAITTTINEIEEVTAAGLNALNDKFDGLKFKRITQEAYDILPIKDENTMYIITSGATSWITIPSGTSLTGLTAFKMRVKDTIQLSESHDVSFGYAAMGETSGNTYSLHYEEGIDVWQKWRLIIDGNYVSDMEDLTSSNGYYTVDFGQKYPCIGGDFDLGQQTTQDAPFEFDIYI